MHNGVLTAHKWFCLVHVTHQRSGQQVVNMQWDRISLAAQMPPKTLCAVCRDHYIPTTEDGIPTGQITPVKGTPFDFTGMKRIGKEIDETPGGYDHNWVLHGLGRQAKFSTKAGSVASEM